MKLINLYPVNEREKVVETINSALKKVKEYKTKYPQYVTSYLKSFLSTMLEKLKEGLEKLQNQWKRHHSLLLKKPTPLEEDEVGDIVD
ncbi:hypothetical protein [Stygiolobus azoricus]|uniref:Uncharacterized protein n=1 Tax=Stygiolobus azoricus TaxID=41675 RepID=A0A650CRP0_9CREN|nr:hypothetical protein [Stygiolobus azoricus]QGR20415.1 hypothetical protein D1868_10755 [Stygiolobus azoricus]